MCGIAGIYAYRPSTAVVDQRELVTIRDCMAARGPNGAGLWMSPDRRLGLAHRRLSIIDLTEAGAQPMMSTSANCVITFNGEIYNFEELRAQLIARGYVFHSHSDTEVLLHLYAHKGRDMLADLRGMFAFAIWDARTQALFLARDTYGIKPLYYSDAGGTLRFASSVKALLAGGGISRELDVAGQAGFYLFGSIPQPFTTCRAISSLPAGSWMVVDGKGPQAPVSFETIAGIYEKAAIEANSLSVDDLRERARPAFLDSVRHHLIADVPVGAFLSAGVDSSALVGLMRDVGANEIKTVTLSFAEFEGRHDDEAPLASGVAKYYGTSHTTRRVTAEEFQRDLPKLLEAMDQPTIEGTNSWFVAKAASELGLKVALSGVGGDELLGGYPSFQDIPRWRGRAALPSRVPGLGIALRQVGRAVLGHTSISPKAFSLVEHGGHTAGSYMLRRGLFLPWELPQLMGSEAAREGLKRLDPANYIKACLPAARSSDFAQVGTLESSLYMRNTVLRDVDWASMAHSLEVRLPLVDVPLLMAIAPLMLRLGAHAGKVLLANAPMKAVPRDVVDRVKSGFGIPVGRWLGISGGRKGDLAYGHSRAWARTVAARSFVGGRPR